MTEYTARQLRTTTEHALRRLADDRRADSNVRARALAALAGLRSEPAPDLREPYVVRYHVQPGLWLTVDASRNIMLEVRTADEAELLAAYALSSAVDMADKLGLCRTARDAAEYDDEAERVRQVNARQRGQLFSAPRDGEDADSRAAALAELTGAGLNAHSAQTVLRRAYGHLEGSFSYGNVPGSKLGTVSYDREAGTYSVRLPERDKLAEVNEAFAELRRLEDRRDAVRGLTAREESRKNIMRDLSPAVHDQATADMAESIADEFSRHGITGIEFAPGSEFCGNMSRHLAHEGSRGHCGGIG